MALCPLRVDSISLFFFFSSRRRHTRSSTVSWARNVYKRQLSPVAGGGTASRGFHPADACARLYGAAVLVSSRNCLLYTSDAADERYSVDLGGRRYIKKKNTKAAVVNL